MEGLAKRRKLDGPQASGCAPPAALHGSSSSAPSAVAAACGCAPPVHRLVGKQPPTLLPLPPTVRLDVYRGSLHRVWLLANDGPRMPSALALQGLRSFAPFPQTLWVTSASSLGQLPEIEGLSVAVLTEQLAPRARLQWLQAQDVDIRLIKDEVSLQVVAACGGFYADFDVISTGLPLMGEDGFLFVEEPPHRQRAGKRVTLAIFGAPCAAEGGHVLADAAREIGAGLDAATSNVLRFMDNTRTFTKWVHASGIAVQPSLLYAPLSLDSLFPPPEIADSDDVPTLEQMIDQTRTINIWGRQWSSASQWRAITWAASLRAARRSGAQPSEPSTVPQCVRVELHRRTPWLEPKVGESVALRSVATALDFLDDHVHRQCPWLEGRWTTHELVNALLHLSLAFQSPPAGWADAERRALRRASAPSGHQDALQCTVEPSMRRDVLQCTVKSPATSSPSPIGASIRTAKADILGACGTSRVRVRSLACVMLNNWAPLGTISV